MLSHSQCYTIKREGNGVKVLTRDDEKRWLSGNILPPNEVKKILVPYPPGEMEAFPVSSRVNSPTVDDERLIQPLQGL